MDVWFDSGSSHRGVLETRPELSFPADMYLEGSDQYRGWFSSSITTSVATRGYHLINSYFLMVLLWTVKVRKWSKSLGNVIVPDQVVKQKVLILRDFG